MLVLYEGKAQVTLNDFHFCPLGIGAQFSAPSNLKDSLSSQMKAIVPELGLKQL